MTHILSKYTDIHSHDRSQQLSGNTVVNITPGTPMLPGGTYSVGIHPWDTAAHIKLSTLKQLVAMARDNRVVAIGEAGFDRMRGGDPACQAAVFDFQARLARRVGKPLIIHCVRAYDMLLAAARRHRPDPGMWIVHGFRKKPELARQLLDAGIDLSMHAEHIERYPDIPRERIHTETDAPDTSLRACLIINENDRVSYFGTD